MKLYYWAGVVAAVLVISVSVCSADEEQSSPFTELEQDVHREKRALPSFWWPRLRKTKIKVATVVQAPWFSYKEVAPGNTPVPQGFLVDLLNLLRLRLRIQPSYETYDKYGSATITIDENNKTVVKWDGLMGALTTANTQIDLAAAPLTITSRRQEYVKFIKPFQHLGLSVVVKQDLFDVHTSMRFPFIFSITYPVEPTVWVVTLAAVFVVGCLMWANNRFNPYEWGGRYNLGRANENEAESFSLAGSFWFAYTTLTWQGYDRAPRSVASKILMCAWFGFIVVALIMYTGSMVNHMFWASSVQSQRIDHKPFKNLEELLMDETYEIGALVNSSTYWYISEAAHGQEFNLIRTRWKQNPGQLAASIDDGLQKVRSGKYAFIMESYMADLYMQRKPCDLTTIGEVFGQRGYGMAMPKKTNASTMEAWDAAIIEAQEKGDIAALEKKWWLDRGECWNQTFFKKAFLPKQAMDLSKPRRITMGMIWAPFVFLLVGALLSFGVAAAEVYYYKKTGKYQDSNRPVGQQLKMDDEAGHM